MINNEEIKELMESIRFMYGYDFTEYSVASIKRRLEHFMEEKKISSIRELAKMLLKEEELFELFIQDLTINVTEMFRDPKFYKALREKIIPRLATYPFIKIWIAGCATGEEVYSVAILLKEEKLLKRSIIYATDINQKVLMSAKEGVFHVTDMQKHTANYIKSGGKNSFSDYYMAKYDSALLDKSLKQNVVFSIHNLAVDKSFNEFQLILCRNVLIYFNQSLQNKVIDLFYESLCPFGVLALGNKESLLFSDKKPYFEEIDKSEKIFMKKNNDTFKP
ncbi:MAG: protein-glutamate O-methyltransferase CheR [Ignavibacteria bacterium]|jgi:chemotaxis protein methyltransferase CheR